MKKRSISLLLALCMLCMVGCSTTTTSTEPATAPQAADSAEPSAAAPAGGETFKVGVCQTMSGAGAYTGEEAVNATKMFIDQVNANGGLNGQMMEYVVYDDQSSPEEAVKAVTKLIEVDHVDACIASSVSTLVLASAGALNDAGIVTFGNGTSPTFMAQPWDYVFRACCNADYNAPLTAEMIKDLGISSVAIFRAQDDAAIATAASFTKSCESMGIPVLTEEAYNEGDSDFSGQITKIMNSGAEAVFMSTQGTAYGVFIKQLRQYGFEGIIFNKESLPADALEIAGDAANYVAFATPYLVYTDLEECAIPSLKAYLQAYYDNYGELPATDVSYRVWDSLLVLQEGARIAGSNEPAAIKDAISTISGLQGLGCKLDYTSGTREGLHEFNKFIHVDNKDILISDWIASGGFDAWKAAK